MALCCLEIISGCATLTRGTKETYRIITDPPGATVVFSTGETCVTPCEVEKKRHSAFTVAIEKDGYEPAFIDVTNKTSTAGTIAMAGNVIMIGSVFWAYIDAVSGATRELTPNPCKITLNPSYRNLSPAAYSDLMGLPQENALPPEGTINGVQ